LLTKRPAGKSLERLPASEAVTALPMEGWPPESGERFPGFEVAESSVPVAESDRA
jgi:hypothetical protein